MGIFWHFPNWQQFWDPSDAVLFLPNMILIKSKQILHSILHPHHVLEQLISSQFGSGLDILRYIFRLQFFWPEDWLIQKLLPRWVYPATIQQTILIQKLEYIFGSPGIFVIISILILICYSNTQETTEHMNHSIFFLRFNLYDIDYRRFKCLSFFVICNCHFNFLVNPLRNSKKFTKKGRHMIWP